MNKGFFSLFLVLSFILGIAFVGNAGAAQQRLFSESASGIASMSRQNFLRTEIELRLDSAIESAMNESARENDFEPESIKKKIHGKISAELDELNEKSNPKMKKEIKCKNISQEEFSHKTAVLVEFLESAYSMQFIFQGSEPIKCEINFLDSKTEAILPKGYTKIIGGILLAN